MKPNKLYCAVLILFITYIFSANYIFNFIIPVKGQAKQINIILPDSSANINFYIDRIQAKTVNWRPGLLIDGWAYINDADAHGQKVFVVLESFDGKKQYVFETNYQERPDVAEEFKEQQLNLQHTGFNAYIPTGTIKTNSYRIMLFIKSNAGSSFTDTGKAGTIANGNFVIQPDTIKGLETPSKKSNIRLKNIEQTENLNFYIDNSANNDDFVDIVGWAFIEDENASNQKVYIVLTTQDNNQQYVFNAELVKRFDVADHFAQPGLNLEDSGFSAHIRKSDLNPSDYNFGIYIENSGVTGFSPIPHP